MTNNTGSGERRPVRLESLSSACLIAGIILRGTRSLCGSDVRILRYLLGLSQQELADAVGVQRGAVVRWESGRHRIRGATEFRLRSLVAARFGSE